MAWGGSERDVPDLSSPGPIEARVREVTSYLAGGAL